jgi:hypothetical protein
MDDRQRQWIATLRQFSERNASRRASIELADSELGAQTAAKALTLRGVAYDPHGDTVEIMLSAADGSHFTHAITGVTSVDVLEHEGKGQEVLRIGEPAGQTLVSVPYGRTAP